ncbi:hypothetical protein LTS18_002677, partial [Coniosporium uncinatum]
KRSLGEEVVPGQMLDSGCRGKSCVGRMSMRCLLLLVVHRLRLHLHLRHLLRHLLRHHQKNHLMTHQLRINLLKSPSLTTYRQFRHRRTRKRRTRKRHMRKHHLRYRLRHRRRNCL